jgi:glucan phosphorylase
MTGWSIGKMAEEGMEVSDDEDAKSLYSKLETEIIPRYY